MTINSSKNTIKPSIGDMVVEFAQAWGSTKETIDLGPMIGDAEHAFREAQFDNFLKWALEQLHKTSPNIQGDSDLQSRMLAGLAQVGSTSFDLTADHLEVLLQRGLPESIIQFVKGAREDHGISDADIFQASRNVAVANTMQLLLGQPCELTPSVFAYSMLYPYTDNYLDDPATAQETKQRFNSILGRRLAGEAVKPGNRREKRIFELIRIIEGENKRNSDVLVYESLQAIHRAQFKSLSLTNTGSFDFDDILQISIEKGGTSVLADAYLVADGELTQGQVRFVFGLGAFLQLVDDLQDLIDDLKSSNTTIFSMGAENKINLELITNRAIGFGIFAMTFLDSFPAPNTTPLKEVMQMSVGKLIIGAVSLNQQFFRREYLQELEARFPFRFDYLKKVRALIKRQKMSFANALNLVTANQSLRY